MKKAYVVVEVVLIALALIACGNAKDANDVAGTPGSDLDDTTYVMEDNNKSTSSTSEEVWDYVPSESEKVITLPYNSGD